MEDCTRQRNNSNDPLDPLSGPQERKTFDLDNCHCKADVRVSAVIHGLGMLRINSYWSQIHHP